MCVCVSVCALSTIGIAAFLRWKKGRPGCKRAERRAMFLTPGNILWAVRVVTGQGCQYLQTKWFQIKKKFEGVT